MSHYMKASKQHWIDRAVATHNFHVEQLRKESKWRMEDTAILLNRSLGSVSQDILIANWLKTHENKIRSFKQRSDALEWVYERKAEMRLNIL